MSHWIQSYSGQKLFLGAPGGEADFSALQLHDLAAMLAKIGRFGGATQRPLSVAQHSLIVAGFVHDLGGTDEECLYGLLHDAHEIAMGDRTTPAKLSGSHASFESDVEFADRIDRAIFRCYGIAEAMPRHTEELIKRADARALIWEARDALAQNPVEDWPAKIAKAYGVKAPETWLYVLNWDDAMRGFYMRQNGLLKAICRPDIPKWAKNLAGRA